MTLRWDAWAAAWRLTWFYRQHRGCPGLRAVQVEGLSGWFCLGHAVGLAASSGTPRLITRLTAVMVGQWTDWSLAPGPNGDRGTG